jgi:hypothetical protein
LYTTTIFRDEQKPTTTKQLLSAKLEHKTQEYIQLVPCARMQLEFENPLLSSTFDGRRRHTKLFPNGSSVSEVGQ